MLELSYGDTGDTATSGSVALKLLPCPAPCSRKLCLEQPRLTIAGAETWPFPFGAKVTCGMSGADGLPGYLT